MSKLRSVSSHVRSEMLYVLNKASQNMYEFHQQLTTSWAEERKHDFNNYYYK